jgi:hypothetical protein
MVLFFSLNKKKHERHFLLKKNSPLGQFRVFMKKEKKKIKLMLLFFPTSEKLMHETEYTFENDYSFKKLFVIPIDNHHTIVLFRRFFCIDKVFFFVHSLHSIRDRDEWVGKFHFRRNKFLTENQLESKKIDFGEY